ncbi:MAG: hypothetical protein ACYC1P_02955 [Gaiellaceae bacterium]
MHARGHLGPLLLADPRRPLGVALERKPPSPRPRTSSSAIATALDSSAVSMPASPAFQSTKAITATIARRAPSAT